MPRLTIDAHLLDKPAVVKARKLMAGILVSVRANKRQRVVEGELRDLIAQLQPGTYMWHWQAWRMGGFERINEVGTTADGKVIVLTPEAVLYGDPLTEEVVRIEPEPTPKVKSKYKFH